MFRIKRTTRHIVIAALAVAGLLLAVAPHVRAQSGFGASFIVTELQARYAGVKTVSAGFTQEFHPFGFDEPVTTAGKVYFKKPGKMKWIYDQGSEDVLTSDGQTVWLYQPDLAQVIETKADFGSTLATDFLSGIGNLRLDFDIKLEKEEAGLYVLALAPVRPQPNVERLLLYVDKTDRTVTRTVVEDLFGNSTRVSFTDIEVNRPIEDSFFAFTPPPGVNVVKQ